MQYIKGNGQNNCRLSVVHRQGYPLAELCDPEDGGQVSVIVHENAWSKKHDIATHPRYFRNRTDAVNFINKTFK